MTDDDKKNKSGRPTLYKSKYCQDIVNFFSVPHTEISYKTTFVKGEPQQVEVEKPNKLPTFEKFAVKIGVCVDTLNEWTKVHEEFSEAYKKAKQLQKDMLIDLGTRGFYNPAFTIFVAKNITDMKDKVEQDINYTPPHIKVEGVNI